MPDFTLYHVTFKIILFSITACNKLIAIALVSNEKQEVNSQTKN